MPTLFEGFTECAAPSGDRRALQLTAGPGMCYPLYYYIPSFSGDGRFLVYHKSEAGQVQLYSLDMATGESIQLTHATAPAAETQWRPWCIEAGAGVLDHRSVLNQDRDEVIYFDGGEVRAVKLSGAEDRRLFELPEDRIPIGQNCVTPDGCWFVYIHHDRETYPLLYPGPDHVQGARRCLSEGTVLAAYNLDTGEHRDLVIINSPIHHVLPYGDEHLVFCHPANEPGMCLTDLRGGWCAHLRTQDEYGGTVCHYVATRRGIAYEVIGRKDVFVGGMMDPFTHRRFEIPLPRHFSAVHTGRDPEGELWFYEDNSPGTHAVYFLTAHDPENGNAWRDLTGHWPTYRNGQKSHFHPQLTPDRNWMLLTAGDPATESNHLFLLDIADLEPTQGVTRVVDV